jgi:plasmid maintenance system antidote protein VapI
VTADTALRLGKFFQTGAAFWMNIQVRYDLERPMTCSRRRSRRLLPARHEQVARMSEAICGDRHNQNADIASLMLRLPW